MKKISTFIIVLVAAISLQSCDKIKDAIGAKYDMNGASADFVIPPYSDTSAQQTLATQSFSYNADSAIKSVSGGLLSMSIVSSIKVKSITLTLSDATTASNFANFSYAGVTFNTNASSSSTLYTLADISNNPDVYSNSLTLNVPSSTQNLKSYFSNNVTITYSAIAKLRRATTDSLHCHANITYEVQ